MKTETIIQVGDRVRVIHNAVLGNTIGTVSAIYERPGNDLYEVNLDRGGIDKMNAFQLEKISDVAGNDNFQQLYESAKIIRRLLNYADQTAENHPQAVTSAGQNARVRAGLWLAKFERENADNPKVSRPPV